MAIESKAITRTAPIGLLLAAAAALAGCLDVEQPNEFPTVTAQVLVGGAPLQPEMVMGVTAPAYKVAVGTTVTLVGVGADLDGTIAGYQWWRTDVSRAMRNGTDTGAAGMGPTAPPFTGDPQPITGGGSVNVALSAPGNYRFSVWAIDDDGVASEPASLTLVVE